MVLISQLRAMNPTLITDAVKKLSEVNDSFVLDMGSMRNDVQNAMAGWKGDAATATSVKSLSEHLAGTRIGDAVKGQVQTITDGVNSLSSARSTALGVADEAIHAGCTVSDDGHVTAPDLKHVVTDPKAYLVAQAAANEKAKGYEARLIPALSSFDDLDTAAEAAVNAGTAEIEGLIKKPGGDAAAASVDDILSGKKKPPEDPKAFTDWWNSLSDGEKNEMYLHDQYIGNHDGMPTVDQDNFNRMKLADELGRATTAAAQADDLRSQHPDWASGKFPPEVMATDEYKAWRRQLDDATNRAKYLPDLQAINQAIGAKPDKAHPGESDRYLKLMDTQTGRQARAAIAVGNPDTADNISVTTPGMNTTVHDAIVPMASEATNLQREALRQLGLAPGHERDTVSTIAWIGYDPPQVDGLNPKSLSGGWEVSHDDIAKAGAHDLARFYDGLASTHQGAPAHVTAIGHSYGSLTTGLALQEPGNHGIKDAIFYGSPGIEATTPEQLGVNPGHVYTMETPNDPIQWVYDGPQILKDLPFGLGTVAEVFTDATDTGNFGPNPADNPNFRHMYTGPASVPDGHDGFLNLEGASGHSDYPRQGDNKLPRTTGYNIAAVIAGLGNTNAIPEN